MCVKVNFRCICNEELAQVTVLIRAKQDMIAAAENNRRQPTS